MRWVAYCLSASGAELNNVLFLVMEGSPRRLISVISGLFIAPGSSRTTQASSFCFGTRWGIRTPDIWYVTPTFYRWTNRAIRMKHQDLNLSLWVYVPSAWPLAILHSLFLLRKEPACFETSRRPCLCVSSHLVLALMWCKILRSWGQDSNLRCGCPTGLQIRCLRPSRLTPASFFRYEQPVCSKIISSFWSKSQW